MKPNIFTIGGAVFDLFVKTHDQAMMKFRTQDASEKWLCLKHGAKIKVEEVIETFGGGATNTAVAFSRMGFKAHFVGKIGAKYGQPVIDNLEKEGVDTAYVKKTDQDKTSFSNIISTFDGDRTVLSYPGANRFFNAKDLPMEALAKADWIFLNHLTEENSRIPAKLLQLLKKYPHIKLAWNPGNEQLSQGVKKWKGLLSRTEALFLNKHESSLFTNTPYQPPAVKMDIPRSKPYSSRHFLPPYASDVRQIMKVFFKHGAKKVIITDGSNGAQASDGKRLYFCPVVSRKRVDTLGAGDAFASGFTSALILGKNLKTALMYGTLNANGVVNQYGAQAGLLKASQLASLAKTTDLSISSTKLSS